MAEAVTRTLAALPPVLGRQSLPKSMTWLQPSHEEMSLLPEEGDHKGTPLRATIKVRFLKPPKFQWHKKPPNESDVDKVGDWQV